MDENNILSVLLIEDIEEEAKIFSNFLSKIIKSSAGKINFEFNHAPDLSSGLKLIKELPIDIIFLDLNLPDSSGDETFVKVFEVASEVPIILISSSIDDKTALNYIKRGAHDYILKYQLTPVSLEKVIMFSIERDKRNKDLNRSRKNYSTLFEKSSLGIALSDNINHQVFECNTALAKMFSTSREALIGRKLCEMITEQEKRDTLLKQLYSEGEVTISAPVSSPEGKTFYAEINCSIVDFNGAPAVQSYFSDITDRVHAEKEKVINLKRAESLLRISQLTTTNQQEFLDFTLNEALSLTESKYGYIYHYDEATKLFELNSWSKDVMAQCLVTEPQTCYVLSETGIWGEAIRQRKEILINDFSAENNLKKGYPEGHVTLHNFLTTPVFIKDKIVAVIGVANKEGNYDESDVKQLQLLMESVWQILENLKTNDRLSKVISAVEQSYNAVMITDKKGIIEYVNPSFEKMSGWNRAEATGRESSLLNSGHHDSEDFAKMWKSIEEGHTWRGEILNKRKDESLFWASISISPVKQPDGRITNFVAIIDDITEKKNMISELISAKNKAEEMNLLKRNFYSNMSHELRTPMIGILGYAEILEEELSDNQQLLEMVEKIAKGGERLISTLNKILIISKLESENNPLNVKNINLCELLEKSVESFRHNSDPDKISIELHMDNSVGIIRTDLEFLEYIVNNIIDNAIRFTREGTVKIQCGMQDSHYTIDVIDTGIGIPAEHLSRIWDEFRQVSEGYGRGAEGTGLGLAISKKSAKLIGADILVESTPGKGSKFTVKLPLRENGNSD